MNVGVLQTFQCPREVYLSVGGSGAPDTAAVVCGNPHIIII